MREGEARVEERSREARVRSHRNSGGPQRRRWDGHRDIHRGNGLLLTRGGGLSTVGLGVEELDDKGIDSGVSGVETGDVSRVGIKLRSNGVGVELAKVGELLECAEVDLELRHLEVVE